MPRPPAEKRCVHLRRASEPCPECERDIADGYVSERKVYVRQLIYRYRLIYTGKCYSCRGPKDNRYEQQCDECREKQQRRVSTRKGFGKWKKGGRGRIPKRYKEEKSETV
jgi:hypothetical protein